MHSPTVLEAFDKLVEELDQEIREARDAAANAIRDGHDDEADRMRRLIRETTALRAKTHALREAWLALLDGKERRRGRKRRETFERAPRGQRLPEEAYYLPILRALEQLGGQAPVKQVLQLVYQQIKDKLTQIDLTPLPSDARTLRWRNAALWARQGLVHKGLVQKDTPFGVWAITPRGREYVAKQSAT